MKKKIRCRNDLNLHTINKLREAKCVFFRFPGGGGGLVGWLVMAAFCSGTRVGKKNMFYLLNQC